MLDLTPENMSEEIEAAEVFRRKHTSRIRDIVRRYVGNWHRMDNSTDPTPDNLVAGYIAFMLPEFSYTTPSATVEAKRPLQHEEIADAVEMMLQQWLKDSDFGDQHQDWVRDALMGFGVMKVGMEPKQQWDDATSGYATSSDGSLIPFACRIPPDQFIMDPRCERWQDARYMGHTYFKDLESLQGDKRWDAAAVEQMSGMTDDESAYENNADSERPFGLAKTPTRQRVGLVDVWIRETNEIITMGRAGNSMSSIQLRRCKYHGPANGPYTVLGFYTVPGDPYPISPLQFAMEQFEELQAHLGSSSEAARSFKRFVMVNAADEDASNAMINAENGSVMKVRGFSTQNYAAVEAGGGNSEQYQYIGSIRDRWDRTMGMGDAQRGQASGKTATESQIVQSNVDGRTSYMKGRAIKFTTDVLDGVCWYLFHDPNIVEDVSRTDPVTGQTFEGLYLGGIQKGQQGLDWSKFNLNVTPESMSATDNQVVQAHAMQLFQLAPQAMQMMMQMPGINVRWLVKMLGEAMNIKQLPELLFNQQLLARLGQVPQAFGQGLPQSLPQGSNPMFFNAGLGFPTGGQQQGAGQPANPMAVTGQQNNQGFARPVNPASNGPNVGPGSSPLPSFGMPKTQGM